MTAVTFWFVLLCAIVAYLVWPILRSILARPWDSLMFAVEGRRLLADSITAVELEQARHEVMVLLTLRECQLIWQATLKADRCRAYAHEGLRQALVVQDTAAVLSWTVALDELQVWR